MNRSAKGPSVRIDRPTVLRNLEEIRARIAGAAGRADRDARDVRLVAIGKTVAEEVLGWAIEAGVRDIGENYVKELAGKRDRIAAQRERLEGVRWHYVGALQSHTVHSVAATADVVHTLIPGRAVERLSRRAEGLGRRLPGLVQVDFTGARTGVAPEEAAAFVDEVAKLPGIELSGLMTLPPIPERAEDARPYFARLRELRDELRTRHDSLVELSMGMSLDYEVAVEEGATMVRVGTALFGERALSM
jgi:pyridoxal phosphate enzyme (YggS family)